MNQSISLADRMKSYEQVSKFFLTKRTPVMIRVDGKAFHTFTKDMQRPFDTTFMNAMVDAAETVACQMQGFKAAYVQSDEVTFCITDYDTHQTQGWFNYELIKIVSVSASLMTAAFNDIINHTKLASFDSRAFNIPHTDVVNAFLWRARDWKRNSLQMYARSWFSHKQLHGKNSKDIHEMLHSVGRNWTTDLTDMQRNGTFITKTYFGPDLMETSEVLPTYDSISSLFGELFEYPDH